MSIHDHPETAAGSPPLTKRALGVVLAIAAFARLLPFLSLVSRSSATWLFGRGLETGFVAHALLSHQGFASPFGGQTGPTALISPGYALLVAAVFRLFGEASTASAVVILLAQVAVGVLTVWLVMRLAERLGGSRAAMLAGCFFALWPPLLWVPTIFWDTSLTLGLMPALLLTALQLRECPTRALWLAFGVLCGCTVLINLALCLTVIAVFCWAAWTSPASRRSALLSAILALAIYSPWPIRNAHALHAFIPLRTTVGLELWMGNRDGATGFLDESIFPLFNSEELRKYVKAGEVAYMREKFAAAGAAIRRHPETFLALSTRRVIRFWFGTGTRGGSPVYAIGATLTSVLGLAAWILLFRRGNRPVALLFALPALLFPLPYYITHAEFRYRLALDPALTALAAYLASNPFLALTKKPARQERGTLRAENESAVTHVS